MIRTVSSGWFLAFLVSACSTAPTSELGAAPSASTISRSAETTTTTSEENNEPIAKNLGDLAGAGCPGPTIDSCAVKFRITKITGCTGAGYEGDPPPTGTTRKLVWMEVETGPSYSVADLPSYVFTQFAAINADGVTTGGELNPSLSWECVPTQANMGFGDQNWMAGKKYAGAIEIYLPDDAVVITNGDGFWRVTTVLTTRRW